MKIQKTVWLIMSKDRKLVAKGTPRNRCLVPVDDDSDQKRYLTYSTKGKAEGAFKTYGFYGMRQIKGLSYRYGQKPDLEKFLEPVEATFTMEFN